AGAAIAPARKVFLRMAPGNVLQVLAPVPALADMREVEHHMLVEITPQQLVLPAEDTGAGLHLQRCQPALAYRQHAAGQLRRKLAGTVNAGEIALLLVGLQARPDKVMQQAAG